jgi:WD40 repeat protein
VLWDIKLGKDIAEHTPGLQRPIVKSDWNSVKTELVATGSQEQRAWILELNAEHTQVVQVRHILHPLDVIGVAWRPQSSGILATGCADGIVRIYECLASADGTLL